MQRKKYLRLSFGCHIHSRMVPTDRRKLDPRKILPHLHVSCEGFDDHCLALHQLPWVPLFSLRAHGGQCFSVYECFWGRQIKTDRESKGSTSSNINISKSEAERKSYKNRHTRKVIVQRQAGRVMEAEEMVEVKTRIVCVLERNRHKQFKRRQRRRKTECWKESGPHHPSRAEYDVKKTDPLSCRQRGAGRKGGEPEDRGCDTSLKRWEMNLQLTADRGQLW